MKIDEKVQFVCFDTTLGKDEFLKRWESFSHSRNSNMDVMIHQVTEGKCFNYMAKHRFIGSELEFKFADAARNSRMARIPINTIQAGGYLTVHVKKNYSTKDEQIKIVAFIPHATVDLEFFKNSKQINNLNIYEAYYENCKYAFILEYFIKTSESAAIITMLKEYGISDIGIYSKSAHIVNAVTNEKEPFSWSK